MASWIQFTRILKSNFSGSFKQQKEKKHGPDRAPAFVNPAPCYSVQTPIYRANAERKHRTVSNRTKLSNNKVRLHPSMLLNNGRGQRHNSGMHRDVLKPTHKRYTIFTIINKLIFNDHMERIFYGGSLQLKCNFCLYSSLICLLPMICCLKFVLV